MPIQVAIIDTIRQNTPMTIHSIKNALNTIADILTDPSILLDEVSEEEEAQRMERCASCEILVKGWCSSKREIDGIKGCGCFIPVKIQLRQFHCPRSLW